MNVMGERMYAYHAAQNCAKSRIAHALKQGDLTRGECERLGADCRGKIHGHHDDYSRPLEVRWLCAFHHRAVHHEIGACLTCRRRWIPEIHEGTRRCPNCHTVQPEGTRVAIDNLVAA